MFINHRMRRRINPNTGKSAGSVNSIKDDRVSLFRMKRNCGEILFSQNGGNRWNAVRAALISELKDEDTEGKTNKSGLYEYLCSDREKDLPVICRQLHIEQRTYYSWRESIIFTGMLIAAEKGCLSILNRRIR